MPRPDDHREPLEDGGFGGEFQREADALRSLSREPVELVDPPDDLWGRIAASAGFDEPEPASFGGAAAERVAPQLRPEEPGRPRQTNRGRRALVTVAAVAAALVLIVGGIAVVRALRDTGSSTVASAELAPYGGAPVGDVRAKVEVQAVDGAQQLRVDMHGLPALAPGTFYELWLIDPTTGTPISVASMKDGSSDVTTVIDLPAGTDTQQYDVVDVSVQEESAGPAHSGNSVLRGILSS